MLFANFPEIGVEQELPIYLVNIGLNEFQHHVVRPNGFEYPQILYSTKGLGKLIIDGTTYIIKPNTAFFLPDHLPHEYYTAGDIWDTHWIVPDGYAIAETLKHFGLDKFKLFNLTDVDELEIYFTNLHNALVSDKLFGNYRAAGALYEFLIEFYRITSGITSENEICSTLKSAVNYIDDHFSDEITFEDLCKRANVTPQHLCRLFKKYFNLRPMEYLAKYRIQEAKAMLNSTNISIAEIAEKVGFSNCNYFCILFKRYENTTPTKYRNRNKLI